MVTSGHVRVIAFPVSRTEITGATAGEKVAPAKLLLLVAYVVENIALTLPGWTGVNALNITVAVMAKRRRRIQLINY
jgi:hypothetical protein